MMVTLKPCDIRTTWLSVAFVALGRGSSMNSGALTLFSLALMAKLEWWLVGRAGGSRVGIDGGGRSGCA